MGSLQLRYLGPQKTGQYPPKDIGRLRYWLQTVQAPNSRQFLIASNHITKY